MKQAVIVAAGPVHQDLSLIPFCTEASLIIAVDGGGAHLAREGILPTLAVGDFDSLPCDVQNYYRQEGLPMRQYDRSKDATDLELALEEALALGAEELLVLGALGGEPDHSLANIYLLLSAAARFRSVRLIDQLHEGFVTIGPSVHRIDGNVGDIFSIVVVSEIAAGVSVQGCRWPLTNVVLKRGTTLSIRNEFRAEQVTLTVESGAAVVWMLNRFGRKEDTSPVHER